MPDTWAILASHLRCCMLRRPLASVWASGRLVCGFPGSSVYPMKLSCRGAQRKHTQACRMACSADPVELWCHRPWLQNGMDPIPWIPKVCARRGGPIVRQRVARSALSVDRGHAAIILVARAQKTQ